MPSPAKSAEQVLDKNWSSVVALPHRQQSID